MDSKDKKKEIGVLGEVKTDEMPGKLEAATNEEVVQWIESQGDEPDKKEVKEKREAGDKRRSP